MAQHRIEVMDSGFNPKSILNVKKDDTVLFVKTGTRVTGVKVTGVYFNDDPSTTTVNGEPIFDIDPINFPAGTSMVELVVKADVPKDTRHTYELDVILAPEQPARQGRGGPQTEKGGITVVSGTGPMPSLNDKKMGIGGGQPAASTRKQQV